MKLLKTPTPLSMQNVELAYKKHRVLDGVSIQLQPGSITGLLGRNGSGKTTLIRTAVGLLKPQHGSTHLFGHQAWECPAKCRQRIGYVAQQFQEMHWLTVEQALDMVGSFYTTWDADLVEQFCLDWDVPTKARIGKLSHGQRQKVGIVLAIGHRPELLILDEPVASLDPVARHEFLRVLLRLNQEIGQTILFSSHITTDVERIAADVAILHEGRVIYHGGLDDLKEQVQCLFFRGEIPRGWRSSIEGFVSMRQDGDRTQVWVKNWNQDKLDELKQKTGQAIHMQRVGLEELFMGMTG